MSSVVCASFGRAKRFDKASLEADGWSELATHVEQSAVDQSDMHLKFDVSCAAALPPRAVAERIVATGAGLLCVDIELDTGCLTSIPALARLLRGLALVVARAEKAHIYASRYRRVDALYDVADVLSEDPGDDWPGIEESLLRDVVLKGPSVLATSLLGLLILEPAYVFMFSIHTEEVGGRPCRIVIPPVLAEGCRFKVSGAILEGLEGFRYPLADLTVEGQHYEPIPVVPLACLGPHTFISTAISLSMPPGAPRIAELRVADGEGLTSLRLPIETGWRVQLLDTDTDIQSMGELHCDCLAALVNGIGPRADIRSAPNMLVARAHEYWDDSVGGEGAFSTMVKNMATSYPQALAFQVPNLWGKTCTAFRDDTIPTDLATMAALTMSLAAAGGQDVDAVRDAIYTAVQAADLSPVGGVPGVKEAAARQVLLQTAGPIRRDSGQWAGGALKAM